MRSWVLRAIVALVVLGGVFGAGAYVGRWSATGERWVAAVEQSHRASIYAYVQYRHADYAAAKLALLDFLALLETTTSSDQSWHPGAEPLVDKRGLAFDKMLTVARLALLEERQHGPPASDEWWVRAERYAHEVEWKDASRGHIRDVVERLDKADDDRGSQIGGAKQ